MGQNFTSAEIDTLLDALDAWVSKPSTNQFISSLLAMSLARNKAEYDSYKEKIDDSTQETSQRQETATLLKARLIVMKRADNEAEIRTKQERL